MTHGYTFVLNGKPYKGWILGCGASYGNVGMITFAQNGTTYMRAIDQTGSNNRWWISQACQSMNGTWDELKNGYAPFFKGMHVVVGSVSNAIHYHVLNNGVLDPAPYTAEADRFWSRWINGGRTFWASFVEAKRDNPVAGEKLGMLEAKHPSNTCSSPYHPLYNPCSNPNQYRLMTYQQESNVAAQPEIWTNSTALFGTPSW